MESPRPGLYDLVEEAEPQLPAQKPTKPFEVDDTLELPAVSDAATNEPLDSTSAAPGLYGLGRAIAVLGIVGLSIVAVAYLVFRVVDLFNACYKIHPALGFVSALGMFLALGALGVFVGRSLYRYKRLQNIEHFQLLWRKATAQRTSDQENREIRMFIDDFVSRQSSAQDAAIRESANRLSLQLHNHADTSQSVLDLEDYLLCRLDEAADKIILRCAAQVAVGTAVATGLMNSVVVILQTVGLITAVARLYAGRPGWAGTLRLLRRSLTNIVVAEIAEQATELFGDVVASKAAAKLGGRAAHGLGNGLMMLRLGAAVKRQCRPVECSAGRLPVSQLVAAVLDSPLPPATLGESSLA